MKLRLPMLRLFLCFTLSVFILGCSQQIKTLMIVSKEKAEQERYIKQQDSKFAQLLEDARENKIKKDLSEQQALRYYGEPLLVKEEAGKTVYLYRTQRNFSQKKRSIFISIARGDSSLSFWKRQSPPSENPPRNN